MNQEACIRDVMESVMIKKALCSWNGTTPQYPMMCMHAGPDVLLKSRPPNAPMKWCQSLAEVGLNEPLK